LTQPLDISSLLPQVADAAREAGDVALAWFRPGERTSASVADKEGGSPVTEADHAVDAFLKARLGALLPEAGWLSEETADTDERLARRRVFIVDPIDGTRAFMHGDTRWGVSIALVEAGEPVLGVLHMPARGDIYAAARGGGARRNDAPIRVSSRANLDDALVAGPRSTLDAMARDGLRIRVEPRIPSLAYRLARVAEGSLDVGVASTNACDWDIAAADLILHEAGGRLTDIQGSRPRYNRRSTRHGLLGASPAWLNAAVTSALRRIVESSSG
jgi:myo-inositol-1(or 4)-monophosphatase